MGKVASEAAAEKLALLLIQTVLDEFAIGRGEKERTKKVDEEAEDGENSTPRKSMLRRGSFDVNEESEDNDVTSNRRKRRNSRSGDFAGGNVEEK